MRSQHMNNSKNGVLPPEFIENIQKNITQRKKPIRSVKKAGEDENWSKIKNDVENLKAKCAEFSRKIEEADSKEEQIELAKKAREIRNEWLEIKAMMDEEK
jgi:seryl-tRNA synthetase